MMETFGVLRRNRETADTIQEIMGLPDGCWSDIQIEFGTNEIATAQVTFLLTGEQLIALAELAHTVNTYPIDVRNADISVDQMTSELVRDDE